MSPQSNKKSLSWVGWLLSGLLVAAACFMWLERQRVIDTIQYYQYTPSAAIESITETIQLTDDATFLFYASQPSLETSDTFNQHCERQESDSPILGCYSARTIYLYDITDERLDGIEEVTAAHELLHAVYERLPANKKAALEPLLDEAYEELADDELQRRMEYYDRTQPGERYNELHSIIATEEVAIGDELERHFAQYFKDRQAVVELHAKVDEQFKQLSSEADALAKRINALASSINSDTEQYNAGVAALNTEVATFNQRASQPGGFSSQAEFEAERARLNARREQLELLRQTVKTNIDTYKTLLAQLESINAQTESLNASIDSVLSEEPEI